MKIYCVVRYDYTWNDVSVVKVFTDRVKAEDLRHELIDDCTCEDIYFEVCVSTLVEQ